MNEIIGWHLKNMYKQHSIKKTAGKITCSFFLREDNIFFIMDLFQNSKS